MRKKIILSLAIILAFILCKAQNNAIEWQRIFDDAYSAEILQTSEGGYVIAGSSGSNALIIKINENGDTLWTKSYGGSGNEWVYSMQLTTDGGYIFAGSTNSNDGDISGNHGGSDFWIVKLNTTGDIIWTKCLGGSNDEIGQYNISIRQTTDLGYIIAGSTNSNDGDVSGNHGQIDAWIVKLNENGEIIWSRCFGGSGTDNSNSIRQTTDGGYIIAGSTDSNDGDVSGNHGGFDAWIIKLNENGNPIWLKCFGGSNGDDITFNTIQQTFDGGYIFAGNTYSNDGDVSGNHGVHDVWVVKLDRNGIIQWSNCYGGSDTDWIYSISQTRDGGYIFGGTTYSNDGDASGNHGMSDAWIVKLNANGENAWEICLGGSKDDGFPFIQQCNDGNYIFVGRTCSTDGDVLGNYGSRSIWIIKLLNIFSDNEICLVTADINSGKNKVIWNKIINENISYYKIYRESAIIDQYEILDSVFYDEPCIYIDNTSIPERRQYQYKISPVFLNKYETEKSPYHKTLFLQYAGSVNGVNLSWEDYTVENGDIGFISYIIYRGNTQNELVPYDSVPSSLHSYTDTDPEAISGTKYYRIAGIRSGSCFPNGNLKSANVESYDRTFSNLSSNNITGLYEPNTKEYPYNLNVFPNPFKKNSIIQYKLDERSRVNIELYNALGENIATILPSQLQEIGAYKYNIETNNFSGFYYLKIKVNEKLIIRKLICN